MQYSDRGKANHFYLRSNHTHSFVCLKEMSEMTFAHLLSLSLSFHTRRKTGEVLRILDRGAAINRVFQLLLFNIFPTFLDITIALGVFVWKFGWELAIIVFFVMFAYGTYFSIFFNYLSSLELCVNGFGCYVMQWPLV